MTRRLSTLLAGLALLSSIAPTAGAQTPPPPGPLVPDALYAAPARLVRVGGGRRLNLLCLGSGSPTVMLETGAGGNLIGWRRVQARIAEFTRVCAYDRAGYGHSDPNTRPTTSLNVVDDLCRLLRASGERSPTVLVGWSLGGLHATLYADKHLSKLAGMVLIDPVFAGAEQQFAALYSPAELADQTKAKIAWRAHYKACAELARAGRLPDPEAKCESPPPGLPAAIHDAFARFYAEPKYYEAAVAEEAAYIASTPDGLSEDDRQEMAAAWSFGDLPLIVLSAEQTFGGPDHGRTPLLREGHRRLAARSAVGKTAVVLRSGHNIQVDQPDAVVDAVREVVEAARRKQAE